MRYYAIEQYSDGPVVVAEFAGEVAESEEIRRHGGFGASFRIEDIKTRAELEAMDGGPRALADWEASDDERYEASFAEATQEVAQEEERFAALSPADQEEWYVTRAVASGMATTEAEAVAQWRESHPPRLASVPEPE